MFFIFDESGTVPNRPLEVDSASGFAVHLPDSSLDALSPVYNNSATPDLASPCAGAGLPAPTQDNIAPQNPLSTAIDAPTLLVAGATASASAPMLSDTADQNPTLTTTHYRKKHSLFGIFMFVGADVHILNIRHHGRHVSQPTYVRRLMCRPNEHKRV
jgi:hypothetical protein